MGADTSVRLEVDGLRKLRADLRRMGDDLGDLKDANADAARLVAAAAEQRAPKRTGALAASGRGNRAAGRAQVLFGGARVPYAAVVHYGWPAHHIAPHPFVIEAARDTEPEWLQLYQAGIDKALDRVAGHTY